MAKTPSSGGSGNGRRTFTTLLKRSRAELVPPAFQFLWLTPRFLVAYGGRASGKSWSIARVLLVLANESRLRVMVCREIMSSIRESAYKLLCDQIARLELNDYVIRADSIGHRNGSEFFFEHLRYNDSRLRSIEGVNICWVEEAQSVSDRSFETLLPTIREPGSRIVISYNPTRPDDPVAERFVHHAPPDTIAKMVTFADNPHLSSESEAERQWLEKTDPDAYRHVWLGEPRTVSDALILRGKYEVTEFEVQPSWAGPYHGLDYGFSRDPSAAVRAYIDDETRTLYVDREFWQLACDIDALPSQLESAIPGISRHVVYADNARPESTSYLARNGIPNARSAEKWPGSVDDGVMYLRAFSRIVIAPACTHLIDEAGRYSYKCDRLTGVPLPEVEDRHNHCIDALRYAIGPLIRNKAAGGAYFSRLSLLVKGEPLELPRPMNEGRPDFVAAFAAITEQPGSAIGFLYVAVSNQLGWPLILLDSDLVELGDLTEARLASVFTRAQQLRELMGARLPATPIIAERALHAALRVVGERGGADIRLLDSTKLPLSLDERAASIRELVGLGQSVKLARDAYARQTAFRAVTGNHLMAQVLGYKPGIKDAEQSLLAAFVLACCASLTGAPRQRYTPEPQTALEAPAAAESPPPPPRRSAPGVSLSLGWHEIDSERVLVERNADNPHWPDNRVPLAPGRHMIDGKIIAVHDLGPGIRVMP